MLKPDVKLFNHQKTGVDFFLANKGVGAFFWEIGTGKTLGALAAFDKLRDKNPRLKAMVICPLSLIEGAWAPDIEKYTTYAWANCRKGGFSGNKAIYIINYEMLLSRRAQGQYRPFLLDHHVMAICDESSKMKNHSAQTTKTLLKMRDVFAHRLILTGTPAPNSETEYWPQMTFLHKHLLHPSFFAFRNRYFHLARGSQVMQGTIFSRAQAREVFSQGFQYSITAANKQALLRKMAPYCHHAKKADLFDLPEQIDETRFVTLSAKHRAQYNDMNRHCVLELSQEKDILAPVVLTKLMKLRQIVSGFVLDERGIHTDLGVNPKLKELLSLLEEAGSQQAIIWCQFRREIEYLMGAVKNSVALYGGTQDKQHPVDLFKNDAAQYLLAHPRSAGHGLTFTNCSLQIFFSLDYSWELYEQSRGRTHRAGQRNPCTYIHLIAKDTIDEQIHAVLQRKGTAQMIVEQWMKRHLKTTS